MATEEALSVAQVREQFDESARLIDEAQRRLGLLADARETNERAANSLERASESVASLAVDGQAALENSAEAMARASAALEAVSAMIGSSDLGALLTTLQSQRDALELVTRQQGELAQGLRGVAEVVERAAQAQAELAARVDAIASTTERTAGVLQDLPEQLRSLHAAVDRTAQMQAERDRVQAKLQRMYDALPGRTQGKVKSILTDQPG